MARLFLFLILLPYLGKTQYAYDKGNHNLIIGYGFPNLASNFAVETLKSTDASSKANQIGQGNSFTYTKSGRGPIFFRYEYAVNERIGLGLVTGYFDYSVSETYNYTKNFNNVVSPTGFYQRINQTGNSFSIGMRFSCHFGESAFIDPYFSFGLGYSRNILNESFESNDPFVNLYPVAPIQSTGFPLYIAGTFGARFYVSKFFSFYAEFGFDKWSILQAGMCFKLSRVKTKTEIP